MTENFQEQSTLLAKNTLEFIGISSELGVNSFILTKQIDSPTLYWGFFCLYPQLPPDSYIYMSFSNDPSRDIRSCRSKVLSLTLPDRIQKLSLPHIPELIIVNELQCALLSYPSVVVAVGDIVSSKEEIICLFCIQGMSPEVALSRLQNNIREYIAESN